MADIGNTSVISPTDASNGTGTMPSWLGSAAPSTLDDAGRALQGAVAREWECRSYPTATGTAPAFVVTYTVAPAALRSGQTYTFTAHAAAVGTDTLNANSLGAKGIKKVVAGVKTVTAANDFYTGDKIACVYDGTDMVWEQRYPDVARTTEANNFTVDQTLTSTDAGAAAGPLLILDRNSASPANGDITGSVVFKGRDNGGGTDTYSTIEGHIFDVTDTSEEGVLVFNTKKTGSLAVRVIIGTGLYTNNATGGDKGVDTVNASEYYKNGVIATRALIATLTTTSGTTQSVTSIPAYRELYIEVCGVSFTAGVVMTLAVSDDNGANYGTARAIAVTTGAAGGVLYGTIRVSNIQTTDSLVIADSITATGATATATVNSVCMAEAGSNTAVINAIQFAGGTFDAGTIRVYGLL